MSFGAFIETGVSDWQIIQQIDGYGEVTISGTWISLENLKNDGEDVFVRVMHEDNCEIVIPWQKAENDGNNKWHITLHQIPVGGLYRIETCLAEKNIVYFEHAKRGDMVHHIGVGDIYVIAGQSNAAGYGRDSVYDAPELCVHLLRNSGKWDLASHPMNESTNSIHLENIETINPSHSPFLMFAKVIKRRVCYPIGLLQCSKGGSALSEWLPNEDGTLYRCMREVIRSQNDKIKGVLWYQGCSDALDPNSSNYLERFKGLVETLRKDLNNDALPFLTVQLNRHRDEKKINDDAQWGTIREAQRQAAKLIPFVYVIPSNDCKLSDGIHNNAISNIALGERIGKQALCHIYKKDNCYAAPDIAFAKKNDANKVKLVFSNIVDRIFCIESPVKLIPFTVEDEIGVNVIISYQECANEIELVLERQMIGNATVSGCFEANPSVFVPIDMVSQIPMLSFYQVPIVTNIK